LTEPIVVIALNTDQAAIACRDAGLSPRQVVVVLTDGRATPAGIYPLASNVVYAEGWAQGHRADEVRRWLQRALAKRSANTVAAAPTPR
jgi:hypothetical protein